MQQVGEGRFAGEILNQKFLLERSGDFWRLCIADCDVLLDNAQTQAIVGLAQEDPAFLIRAGLNPQLLYAVPEREVADLDALTGQLPAGEAVLLDKTTVANALRATDADENLDPVMLLDLSVVAFAFVTYDNVIVQPHSWPEWKDDDGRFAGVLRTLTTSRDSITGILWSICAPLKMTDYERTGFSAAWRSFLGRDDIRIDGDILNHFQDSPLYWDGVPASHYIDAHRLGRRDGKSLSEFLTVQTIRALFNDTMVGLLKLPYLSTSIRAPIYSQLLRGKLEAQLLADKLLGSLGPGALKPGSDDVYVVEASAPFLLGIIFSRITSPSDFWPALHKLRGELAPLRSRLKEERGEWQGRSGAYLRSYMRHLNDYLPADAKLAENAVEATATTVASVATGSPFGGEAAKLLIKLVQLLAPAKKAYDWYLRTFRPDVSVVVELSKEASKLRSVEAEIHRIWKQNWDRTSREHLEWLALARPEAFAKLRNLG